MVEQKNNRNQIITWSKSLTLLLECEVFREMATLVVPPQEEEGGGVNELQGPQVDHALERNGGEMY